MIAQFTIYTTYQYWMFITITTVPSNSPAVLISIWIIIMIIGYGQTRIGTHECHLKDLWTAAD